jgi:hypothetical protein
MCQGGVDHTVDTWNALRKTGGGQHIEQSMQLSLIDRSDALFPVAFCGGAPGPGGDV